MNLGVVISHLTQLFQPKLIGLLLTVSLCAFLISCRPVSKNVQAEPNQAQTKKSEDKYGPPVIVGTIKSPAVSESSGLVASRTAPGLYWTHNDSGDGPFIYAIGSKGESFGIWRVTDANAVDWEDISSGPGPDAKKSYLYIGDIGDNDSSRTEVVIYRVVEPTPTAADSQVAKSNARITEAAEAIRLRYPDGKHDAETLLINPKTGDIYIISKIALDNPTVYEAKAPFVANKTTTMKSLGQLKIPSLFGGVLTGGSVSPDGRRVALVDYFQGYEIVLPKGSNNFDDIWKERLVPFDFAKRKQGESITYRLDGRALLGTSEGKGSQIVQVER
ncbi:MAG TPA: hypothetical protein VI306_10420 [Pyrinomonadaceae bacterium]